MDKPGDKRRDKSVDHPNDDSDSDVVLATRLYELSLRYYVAGMEFAQSPYAFHTIGSTMAVHATRYASVRGFPKRQAGEDFYLLNKLAKVGAIETIEQETECGPIEIRSRRSDRVPFGTGAAVNQITALDQPVRDFRFYNPAVFVLLRRWLDCLPSLWHQSSSDYSKILRQRPPVYCSDAISLESTLANHALIDGLQTLGTDAALAHAYRQSKDQEQFSRQMHTWFDAFRTLKLIHHLRAHELASISYETLASDRIFRELIVRDPQLARFFRLLRQTTQAMERSRAGSGQ